MGAYGDEGLILAVLDAGGSILWNDVVISRPGSLATDLQAVWTGSEIGVAWTDGRWSDPPCGADTWWSDEDCNTEIAFARVGFCE